MKEKLIEIRNLAQALQLESKAIDGHSDEASYLDCWRFLIDDLNDLIDEAD